MTTKFTLGDPVRIRSEDPPSHHRVPRYTRGATGIIVAVAGFWPLADEKALGVCGPLQAVYRVEFHARDLFGKGEHRIMVDVWESWLEGVRRNGDR